MRYIPALSIEKAVAMVSEGASVMAGGTVLVPLLARSGGSGQTLVDIGGLAQLREMGFKDDGVELGATVTIDRIAVHPRIQNQLTALSQAAAAIGNPQVRRAATVGGNIALAGPTSDLHPALLSLDAEIACSNDQGSAWFPMANFSGSRQLITSVRIRIVPGRKSAFRKFAWRRASGLTIASISVVVTLQETRVHSARIAVGGVCANAVLLSNAEAALQGRNAGLETAQEIAELAAEEAPCNLPDPPASRYRRRLIRAGVHEALSEVFASAAG